MRKVWLGVGTLAVGVAAALAGPGTAHADADRGNSSGARVAHSPTSSSGDSRVSEQIHVMGRGAMALAAPRPASTVTRTIETVVPQARSLAPPASPVTRTAPAATIAPAAPAVPAVSYRVSNPIPARTQWNANYGYCGETSFISAGLNYGQYLSQYDARAIASNNMRQSLSASQLLLGVNDVAAAKKMHLNAVPFNTAQQTTTAQFLTWAKTNVMAGYPVVIGVYTNEYRFDGNTNPNAGDAEYDHIVTVTGFSSNHPLTAPAAYYADDVITFNDNGIWTGTPNGLPQNVFSYALGSFPATRRQANAAAGPVYSLSNAKDYGIAITGVADLNRETVPVRLTTSTVGESPAMVEGSSTRPAAKPVTLTITVSGLTAGKTYNLYRYSSMSAVPDSNFNANAAKSAQKWKIVATGSTYTMTQTVLSSETAAYRAVPITAR